MTEFVTKAGNNFVVNSTTPNSQDEPRITRLANGGFVVTWSDRSGEDGDPSRAIRARLFDADGQPLGEDFHVHTTFSGDQNSSTISALDGGGFVVAWYGGSTLLRAQVFDDNGGKVGGEFVLNAGSADFRNQVEVVGLAGGGFAATWAQWDVVDTADIVVRVYDNAYQPLATEVVINTQTTGYQSEPRITALETGFVVVWTDSIQRFAAEVKGRVFGQDGTPLGGEFLINIETDDEQNLPAVARLEGGGFVVVWSDTNVQGDDIQFVAARLYDSAGQAIGADFRISVQPASQQGVARVAALEGGGFVVTWYDGNDIGDDFGSLRGRLFDNDGNPISNEFAISTPVEGNGSVGALSEVIGLGNGDFVVVWSASDGNNNGIRAQRFSVNDADAENDAVTVQSNADKVSIDVLANDSPEGSTILNIGAIGVLSAHPAIDAGDIQVTIVDNKLLVDLGADFDQFAFGDDATFNIEYTMTDPLGTTSTATLTLNVHFNSAPDVDDQNYGVTEAKTITGNLLASATDAEGDAFGVTAINGTAGNLTKAVAGTYGSLTVSADGKFSYIANLPAALYLTTGQTAQDKFTFTTTDEFGNAATDDLSFDVAGAFNSIVGASGNDKITGTKYDDAIDAGKGNDTIDALGGNDDLFGGIGNDILIGGSDSDHLDGGDGVDTANYSASLFGIALDLQTGVGIGGDAHGDTVVNVENIVGSSQNDTLDGSAAANKIEGGAGNDTMSGREGKDILDGGAGLSDRLDYSYLAAGITVSLGAYNASTKASAVSTTFGITEDVDTVSNFEQIFGGAGNDKFTGNTAANELFGEGGADYLNGAAGDDILEGGEGDDILIGGAGRDTLRGGDGIDTASYATSTTAVVVSLGAGYGTFGDANFDTLFGIENLTGGAGNDTLFGDSQDNVLNGGAGNDYLDGDGGSNILIGAGGNDTFYGGHSTTTFVSFVNALGGVVADLTTATATGEGTDKLDSIQNIIGSNFSDTLRGEHNANKLDGGKGNDLLFGGYGGSQPVGDELIGGDGNDTATFNGFFIDSGVTVDLSIAGFQDTGGAAYQSLSQIENLIGTKYSDHLIGDSTANKLDGGAGDDVIDGAGGDDTLIGGAHGVSGDTVTYANATGAVAVNLSLTGVQDTKSAGKARIFQFENLIGSDHSDSLIGSNTANEIIGGDGDDTIDGSTGNDFIMGGAGDDLLIGGPGNDTFIGGDGIDTVSYASMKTAVTVNLILQEASYKNGQVTEIDSFYLVENLIGGSGNDVLTGRDGTSRILGGAGDDIIDGVGKADFLDGGAGTNDILSFASSATYVSVTLLDTGEIIATRGINHIVDSGVVINFEHVMGSGNADFLTGNKFANILYGGANADTLAGLGGADKLVGGTGGNTADYSESATAVIVNLNLQGTYNEKTSVFAGGKAQAGGDAAGDILYDIDHVVGTDFNDILTGDLGFNHLFGGLGDDILAGGAGANNDEFHGGDGIDTVTYMSSTGGVAVSLTSIFYGTGDAVFDSFESIENLIGTKKDDSLAGDKNANRLVGSDGNDTLIGGQGDDLLDGGAGTRDIVSYFDASAGITVDLSQQSIVNAITGAFTSGASHGNADIGWDKISGIEGVIGSEYADQIIGSASDDFIEGRGGGDILDGGAGTSDTVSYAQSFGVTVVLGAENVVSNPAGGHAAGDQIKNFENVFGSLFDDSLTGNSASNILTGGYGNDELTGGGGNDTFVYRYASEDGDTIHDFNSGDKIQIVKSGYEISNAVGLNGFRLNNFAIDYFVQNSTGQATKSGHGQFIYNTSNDTLYWDYDGTGIADSVEVAVFSNGYLLKASDFTLV